MSTDDQLWFPGAIYHIFCYNTQSLFQENADYVSYFNILERVRSHYPFYLHSYCLITSQVHLLVETIHVPINDIINEINKEYLTYFFNRRNQLVEDLRNSYILINSADYFLQSSKSIHLLPLLLTESLDRYRWSSYNTFVNKTPNDHVVTSRILTYFPHPKIEHYRHFVELDKERLLKEDIYEPSSINRSTL